MILVGLGYQVVHLPNYRETTYIDTTPPRGPLRKLNNLQVTTDRLLLFSYLALGSLWLSSASALHDHSYHPFTYEQVTSTRHATQLSASLSFPTPFAAPFSEASKLLPTNITYTTYTLVPQRTPVPDDQYGQDAYAALWCNLSYSSAPPFTTTATPTAIPTSELVFPPPLYTMQDTSHLRLPKGFVWGVSASAWQTEGGLQVEGRGPSILDTIGAIQTNDTLSDSNIAEMGYFLYKDDIARLAAIGVPHLSFSVSWTRIVPFGVAGSPINKLGLQHYDDVINTCLEYGITPIVTLNHFDFPASLMTDLSTLPEHFLYYAKVVMTHYSDRVPFWFSFNEPNVGVEYLYNEWNDLTHILTAHADVYRWYKDELNGTGKLSMKFANNLGVPLDWSNAKHVDGAHRYQKFILGIMGNPLFLGEQFPHEVLTTSGLGLTPLTEAQISRFHGTVNFWAFDPYVAQFVSPAPGGIEVCAANSSAPDWPYCILSTMVQKDGWLMGDMSNAYAAIAPQYVRQQLGYVWDTFKPSGVMITEFGFNQFADAERSVEAQRQDLERTLYYQGFLQETLKAIHEDGVNVIGALAWSYLDNNEFGSYTNHYGMQVVNKTDGTFRRQFKRSIFDFVDFFQGHTI